MFFFGLVPEGDLLIEDEFVIIGGLYLISDSFPLMLQIDSTWEFDFEC